MKIMINKFLIVVVFLLSVVDAVAAPPAPPPPIPPPGPINDNLAVLVILALFFGVRTIYKRRLKTKASV
jgi:hypothetical protein